MAKTIGYVTGHHKTSDTGTASRLGSTGVTVKARTQRTVITVIVESGGMVNVKVTRDGYLLHEYDLDVPEGERGRARYMDNPVTHTQDWSQSPYTASS